MIQGSIFPSFINRKMEISGPFQLSADKTHIVVPPAFTKGKSKIEKGEVFSFITELKLQMFENVVSVEWNPELEKASKGMFCGTSTVGPGDSPRALRGYLTAARDFKINELEWLCKLWVHSR
jgi:hypothetical protein